MSSTSSDSEMNFDSEDSEIYYIAAVETEKNDQADDTLGLWPTENGQSNTRRRWVLTNVLH